MNAMQYLKGASKGIAYSTKEVYKEYNPTTTALADTAKDLASELKESVKSLKAYIKYSKESPESLYNQSKSVAKEFGRNLAEDVKTGNWYNTQRIAESDAEMMKSMGFDDISSSIDDDFGDFEDSDNNGMAAISKVAQTQLASDKATTKAVIKSMDSIGGKVSGAVSAAFVQNANYIVAAQRESAQALYSLNARGFETINIGLSAVNANISNLVTLGKPLAEHIQNSTKFYIKSQEYQDKVLRSLQQIQENTASHSATGTVKNNPSVLGYNGALDPSAYVNFVKGNIKNSTSMLGMFGGFKNGFMGMSPKDLLGMMSNSNSPMLAILPFLMKSMMPKGAKDAQTSFNETLGGFMGSLFDKLRTTSTAGKGPLGIGNLWEYVLKDIFIPKSQYKEKIDQSKYIKGKVDWDGMSRKALMDVIPYQLSEIVSALTGEEQRIFDYNSGTWKSIKTIQKNFNDKKNRYAEMAGGDYINNAKNTVRNLSNSGKLSPDQAKAYLDQISQFQNSAFSSNNSNYMDFARKKKGTNTYERSSADIAKEFGVSPEAIEFLRNYHSTSKKKDRVTWSSRNAYYRNQYGQDISNEENSGSSEYNVLYNGANISENRFGGNKARNLLGVDSDGNDLFYYLKNIYLYNQHFSKNLKFLMPKNQDIRMEGASVTRNGATSGKSNSIAPVNLKAISPEDIKGAYNATIGEEKPLFELSDAAKFYQDHKDDPAVSFTNEEREKYEKEIKQAGALNDTTGRIKNTLADKFHIKNIKKAYNKFTSKPTSILEGILGDAEGELDRILFGDNENEEGFIQKQVNKLKAKNEGAGASGIIKSKLKIPKVNNSPSQIKKANLADITKEKIINAGNTIGNGIDALTDKFSAKFNKDEDPVSQLFYQTTIFAKRKIGGFIDRIMPQDEKTMKDQKDKIAKVAGAALKDAGDAKGAMALGAIVGTGASLFTGGLLGPIVGAGIGAATGLVAKSKDLQDALFGKTDENGEYKKGLLPKKVGDFMKEKLPTIGKNAGGGAVAGLFLGSPVMGAVLGSAVGYVKSSENAKKILFGEKEYDANGKETGLRKGGYVSKEMQKKLKERMPGIKIGAIAGLLTGPFGAVGNIIAGSAVGFAASSNRFQDWLFGKENKKTGKREGGMLGIIKTNVTGPIVDIFTNTANRIRDDLKFGVTNHLKKARNMLFKNLSKLFGKEVKNSAIGKLVGNVLGGFGIIKNIGTKISNRNLKQGTDVFSAKLGRNLSASERLDKRSDAGKNSAQGIIDNYLANASEDEIKKFKDTAAQLQDPTKALENQLNDAQGNIKDTLQEGIDNETISRKEANNIIKAISSGKYDSKTLKVRIANSGLNQKTKEQLSKYIDQHREATSNLKNARKNPGSMKSTIMQQNGLSKEVQEALSNYSGKQLIGAESVAESELNSDRFSTEGKAATAQETIAKSVTGKIPEQVDTLISEVRNLPIKFKELLQNKFVAHTGEKPIGSLPSMVGVDKTSGNLQEDTKAEGSIGRNAQGLVTIHTHGQDVVDNSKTINKKALEEQNEVNGSIKFVPLLGAKLNRINATLSNLSTGIVGSTKGKKPGIFDKIKDFFGSKNNTVTKWLSKFFGGKGDVAADAVGGEGGLSFSKVLGTIFTDVLLPALAIGSLTGKFNDTAAAMGIAGKSNNSKLIDKTTGNEVQQDSNGNFVDITTGETVDSKNISTKITDGANWQGKVVGNAVRGALTQRTFRKGSALYKATKGANSAVDLIAKNTSIGKKITAATAKKAEKSAAKTAAKAATKVAEGSALSAASTAVKTLENGAEAAEASEHTASAISKIAKAAKKLPFLKKIDLDGAFSKFSAKISEKIATAGEKLAAKGVLSTVNKVLFVVNIAFMVDDLVTGWQDAAKTMKVQKPTMAQKTTAALIRLLKNQIPIIGTLVDDSFIIDIFAPYICVAFGESYADFKKQRTDAQQELDEYNQANGTSLNWEQYRTEVKGDTNINQKAGAAVKTGIAKAKSLFTKNKTGNTTSASPTVNKKLNSNTASTASSAMSYDTETSAQGSGLAGGSSFVSQLDSKYANRRLGNSTVGDMGCGPAAAAMALNKTNNMDSAINLANNYQTSGGTDASYFADYFNRNGASASYYNGNSSGGKANILGSIASGNPTILMGRDSSNTSKANSPFGPNNHYVVASGMDDRGNLYINDPESNSGNQRYSSSILKNVSLGIGASGSGLRKRFGIGGGASNYPHTTRNDATTQAVWSFFRSKGYSEAATAGIMGNMQVESGIDPTRHQIKGTAKGIVQWEGSRFRSMEAFAKSRGKSWDDLESQLMFVDQEIQGLNGYFVRNAGTTLDAFKQETDVTAAAENFEKAFERAGKPNMTNRIASAQYYYQTFSGKTIDSSQATSTSSDGSDGVTASSDAAAQALSASLRSGSSSASSASTDVGSTTTGTTSSGTTSLASLGLGGILSSINNAFTSIGSGMAVGDVSTSASGSGLAAGKSKLSSINNARKSSTLSTNVSGKASNNNKYNMTKDSAELLKVIIGLVQSVVTNTSKVNAIYSVLNEYCKNNGTDTKALSANSSASGSGLNKSNPTNTRYNNLNSGRSDDSLDDLKNTIDQILAS